MVLVLFAAFTILKHEELQVEFPLDDAADWSKTDDASTNLRASSQAVSDESDQRGGLTSDDENEEESETNTHEASKKATVIYPSSSSCSGLTDHGGEEVSIIWIPVSPDLSIASRLEKSIRGGTTGSSNPERKDETKEALLVKEICPLPTSQVKIINKCSHWALQAFDANGNKKTAGGDEFYVTYHNGPLTNSSNTTSASRRPPTAVAKVQDFSNGTYRLDFVQSPFLLQHATLSNNNVPPPGTITVTFQYTCGIGAWNPPSKARWKSSGTIAVKHSHYPVHFPPPMEPFVSPTNTVIHDDRESHNESATISSKGSKKTTVFLDWMDESVSADTKDSSTSTISNNETKSDAYKEPFILAFGDSLMQQFVKSWKQTEIPNVGMSLNTTTVHDWMELFERRLGPKLKSLASGSKAQTRIVALIVGSSTWDLLEPQSSGGSGWDDHASAMKTLIDFIQQKYLSKSKNLRLFWKSPTALHVHIPMLENKVFQTASNDEFMHNRIKYMSASRSQELYAVQKRVCTLLKIPFLDVYEMSYLSADHTQIGDGRHFDQEFNRYALQSFLKYSVVEHFWLRYTQRKVVSKSSRILRVRYCPDSWVDTIQAVLVAAVTSRQLELDPEEESCDTWRNYESFLLQASLGVQFMNESTISKSKKKNVATLDERLPFPLSLDALVEGGWIPNSIGSPSYQVATEAFEEGTSYLYGMIWYDLLSQTLTPQQQRDDHQETTAGNPNPNHFLVLAVHDSSSDGQGDIRKCMDELLQSSAHLYGNEFREWMVCRVLFTTEQGIKVWGGIIRQDYNCTPELLPFTAREEYNGDETSANYQMVWQHANAIGKMAKDGYIARCANGNDRLFNSLVDYIRVKEAKTVGDSQKQHFSCCM